MATSRRFATAGVAALTALAGLTALAPRAEAAGGALGAITSFSQHGDTYSVRSGDAALRVVVEDDSLLRIQVAPDGTFTDPANDNPTDPDAPDADIVVKTDYPGAASKVKQTATAYVISTPKAKLTITKSPITLHLAKADGTPLWDETAPLSWNGDGTTQSLAQGTTEQFFGGGMQNGRFSHRDSVLNISADYNWNDGGNPNAAPFYLSSNGYGVLRDTFAPGTYNFGSPVRTTHDEQRFDAYYFVGDARQVINGYTELTGRPVALPMYALELGDADCYLHNANQGERQTLRDSTTVADGYAANRLPLGWMLVNDGYGCGYEDLPQTGDMLQSHGSELGLWTQSDLTAQESEVAAGVRVRKTDVAWVGPGYRFALDACEKARDGIQTNSTDRATVLTIEGWAGTQRCGAVWSGDQSGSWDYIKWQIPTYAGATMSGQPVSTGDVDGIFDGGAQTYARDLQWKMFLPMTYAMNGWAASDKHPYSYGEPYTSMNRKYLMLHEQLLPYFYTYTMDATKDGVGPTRPLYLDYPDDPNTWGDKAKYEFLAGDDFLVAPVYSDTSVRDGIYLPKGQWVDYWTGRIYQGGQTVNGYKAPLDTLPLFVRAGAVVPMFPEGTMDWAAGKKAGELDLAVYPSGNSTFTNYEDDGRSQQHTTGKFATQRFDVAAPKRGAGTVDVTIGALKGSYAGKPTTRAYRLSVHSDDQPSVVTVAGQKLAEVSSKTALDQARSGWRFDGASGVVDVKTPSLGTGRTALVSLRGTAAVGGLHPTDRSASVDLTADRISAAGQAQQVTATFTNGTSDPVQVSGIALGLPTGWTSRATSPVTAKRVPSGGTFAATFSVTPPASAPPGTVELRVDAAYTAHQRSYSVSDRVNTTLAYASIAAAANNVAVTASADPAPGDIDGGGSSFLAERLAGQGVTPGSTVQANGFTFTWPDAQPGTKDNVAAGGQTIRLDGLGQGNALALLGTGTGAAASGSATVHYSDGSTAVATLGMPNWCCLATDSFGAKIAVTTLGKNTPTGPAYPTTEYRLYTKALRVDPAKQVVAVTLPDNATIHVFAAAVGTEDVVPPPLADGQYSLTTGGNALQAPGTSSEQLTVAAPTNDPSQKWAITVQDDGAYQIKNAGSGQCVDDFGSSQTSGDVVGQYGCTGNDNQRWVVTNSAGVLTLKNKGSGLSLTVGADGKVVQATDTAAPGQRWTAVPN